MKRFLFLFFLLLILSTANAHNYCTQEVYADSIIISNNYGSTVHYTISATGNAKIFTTLDSELSFFLTNGESKTINFQTNLPFTGTYELNIIVENSKGSQTTYSYDFNVENCHKISAEIITNESYCLNGPAEYTLIINNTGNYTESFEVIAGNDSFNEYLTSGESKNYTLFYQPENIMDNQISLSIENNQISLFETYELNIINCDESTYEISDIGMCESTTTNHEFVLKNTGIHADNYTISTNSHVIELSQTSVSINASEEVIIPFTLSTDCNSLGIKITSIKVTPTLSEEMNIPVVYNVSNCYEQEIRLLSILDDYCETDNKNITISLQNTGTQHNSYNTSIRFGNHTENVNYELESGEIINITVFQENILNDLIFSFESTDLSACSNNFEMSELIPVSSYKTCYSGSMNLEPTFFNNRTRLEIINNGTRTNEYFISIWAHNEVDNMSVILEPSESKTFVLTNLMNIHDEFGTESFQVVLTGQGFNQLKSNTTYYDNNIIGMVVSTASNASFMLGITILLVIIYAFIKKK